MTRFTTYTALLGLAAVLGFTPPLAAQSPPKTVAEGLARLAQVPRESYSRPPGNVRGEDYRALFGNTVMIRGGNMKAHVKDPLANMKVIFMGADGRYVWCSEDIDGKRYTNRVQWAAYRMKYRTGWIPVLKPSTKPEHIRKRGGNSPLYDGATGQIIWYTLYHGRWWDWNTGHLQARVPAAVYTLCPDFPSPEELGVGLNAKQTATNYPALLAQDPGRRILRPDLVTPNPVEPIN